MAVIHLDLTQIKMVVSHVFPARSWGSLWDVEAQKPARLPTCFSASLGLTADECAYVNESAEIFTGPWQVQIHVQLKRIQIDNNPHKTKNELI